MKRVGIFPTGDAGLGSLRKAEGVLADAALDEFQCELPHWWQRVGDFFIRPFAGCLPFQAGTSPWVLFRSEKTLRGSGLVKSEGGTSHLKLHAWLEEVCRVLGLSDMGSQTRRRLSRSPRCPQLWIDQGWPPSRLTPRSKRSAPIWMFLMPGERDALVVQMSLLKEYGAKEIKALMGFEIGQLVMKRLPALLPQELAEPLTFGFLAARAYDTFRRATEPNQALAGAPTWIRNMLRGRPQWSWKRSYSQTGTTSEFEALGMILRRLVPGPLQPPMFAGLAVNSKEIEHALKHRNAPPNLHLRATARPKPLNGLARDALILGLARLLSGSRGRSYVLTLDRVAALAAGDATAAASALLRAHRLLPPQQTDLRRTLGNVADVAQEKMWVYRREAVLQNPREPPPSVRVAELLSWSQSEQAKRLLALAEMRRARWSSWSPWSPWSSRMQVHMGHTQFWKPWMGYAGLAILLIPIATSIDAVRWASWCTMSLTGFGLLLPLLQFAGAPTLPFASISSLWIALFLYSMIAGSIWWNHLLGGARRWAVLSGQLAAQLVDQADTATGIAFLTRDWAEMARRSLAALDQELCGSWRTSLHELASKLADLRQELEVRTQQGNGNGMKSLKDGFTSDEGEAVLAEPSAAKHLQPSYSHPFLLNLWDKFCRSVPSFYQTSKLPKMPNYVKPR
ncbi:unnamed protein product [Symbiodinium natans]|uniref:Uncharacterized protein n=1 Tax=Symbiodinium natans TaxID=878477 RepID=A0A812M3J5_9DINO|nr:unnamed protein product [Symbiodinium natans]